MTPQQNIEFTTLLELFIETTGMDNMHIVQKAQELLDLINE